MKKLTLKDMEEAFEALGLSFDLDDDGVLEPPVTVNSRINEGLCSGDTAMNSAARVVDAWLWARNGSWPEMFHKSAWRQLGIKSN